MRKALKMCSAIKNALRFLGRRGRANSQKGGLLRDPGVEGLVTPFPLPSTASFISGAAQAFSQVPYFHLKGQYVLIKIKSHL